MAKKFYISDCHFGHENVIQFDKRSFASAEEMDLVMIEKWKECVKNDDEVYIIGDFCYRSDKGPILSTFSITDLRGCKR